MTRDYYHKLISRIYWISLFLCTAFCIFILYRWGWISPVSSEGIDAGLLFPRQKTIELIIVVWGSLFVSPAIATWVIAGLIRITNALEPLNEEQRKQSLVGRMSGIQLFLPLSLFMLLIYFFSKNLEEYYIPAIDFYLVTLGHFIFVWLLVWFLKKIAGFRKIYLKIIFIFLFIFITVVYTLVSSTGLYNRAQTSDYYWYLREEAERTAADYEENQDYEEGNEYNNMRQDELANEQTDMLLEVYDYNNDDPDGTIYADRMIQAAGNILTFNPDGIYSDVSFSNDEMTEEEREQQEAKNKKYFENKQELSRYYNWLRNTDYDQFKSMNRWMRKALLKKSNRYDYKPFAESVDALDMAYYDLLEHGAKIYDNEYASEYFGDVYQHARKVGLYWENYSEIIVDPYIQYMAENNDTDLLLWAYTFWGRRYTDGSVDYWRQVLDEILEVYPNTHYPQKEMEKQREMYRMAETRVQEFLQWYKANYWSFKELKVAHYDEQGNLAKLDQEEFAKYLYALKKSGYLSPQTLKKLESDFEQQANAIQGESRRQKTDEWLRQDPLFADYKTIAEEMSEATCNTIKVIKPGEMMYIQTSIKQLGAFVERKDGVWQITKFSPLE